MRSTILHLRGNAYAAQLGTGFNIPTDGEEENCPAEVGFFIWNDPAVDIEADMNPAE